MTDAMHLQAARRMQSLVRDGDIEGIRALAQEDPKMLRVAPHDFFWEAIKAHGLATDEELALLLGTLAELGHDAFHRGYNSLHLTIKQDMLLSAAELLDAQADLPNSDRGEWMLATLRNPQTFDLARAWKWRGRSEQDQWHATLIAGGVLFGSPVATLRELHGWLDRDFRDARVHEHMLGWLALHVTELAEGSASRLAPTEQSAAWWVQTAGTARAEQLWQQVAAEHWPTIGAFKALVDSATLARHTPTTSEAAARPRF